MNKHTETHAISLAVDQDQACKQLRYFSYDPAKNVFLRFFYPSHDPRKDKDKGRKLSTFDSAQVEGLQQEGRGAYVVVNGANGGHTDKSITKCVALFCEWDDLGLEQQRSRWKDAGFVEPTFTIFSGGKSMQTYWVFKEPLEDIQYWRKLQKALIAKLGADKANCNPSRVLRLAGAWYFHEEKEPVQSTFVQESGIRYAVEELEKHLPLPPKPPKKYAPPHSHSVFHDKVPLSCCLTKDDRALLEQGSPVGSRNTDGAKLARNLIGTAARLSALNIPCTDDPYDLFIHYCRRCAPSDWSEREWEQVWQSASAAHPTPSLSDEAIYNCVRAWRKKVRMSAESRREADQRVRAEEWGVHPHLSQIPDSFEPEREFVQMITRQLYTKRPWIAVGKELYCWEGTYYKKVNEDLERKRIADFLNTYPVVIKGEVRYPYARMSKVNEALEWAKTRFSVDPERVNPPGVNCTNGVLRVVWNGMQPSWKLTPHDPDVYYTYEPQVRFDPDADPTQCDRLLECLEPAQREIFVRTIGASLDLVTVRKFKGRKVKALLLKGDGSNGKDSLREVTQMLYGNCGMTSCSLSDFKCYDQGRKFPLARLALSRINWSSENVAATMLDRIQSLKAFVTGDNLISERKGKDEYEFTPTSLGIFNVNDVPNLCASLEAIKSRYAILSFDKIYTDSAHPRPGELRADPRFRYDPEFLRNEVLPAFLNRVLEGLVALMESGIDYSCTGKTLTEVQNTYSHLFQFCEDTGFGYKPGSVVTAKDIWLQLEPWYVENGTLEYIELGNGKAKAIWLEQARVGDRNCKGMNQVLARFQELFPRAKRVTVPHETGKKRIAALEGLGFRGPDEGEEKSPPHTSVEKVESTDWGGSPWDADEMEVSRGGASGASGVERSGAGVEVSPSITEDYKESLEEVPTAHTPPHTGVAPQEKPLPQNFHPSHPTNARKEDKSIQDDAEVLAALEEDIADIQEVSFRLATRSRDWGYAEGLWRDVVEKYGSDTTRCLLTRVRPELREFVKEIGRHTHGDSNSA